MTEQNRVSPADIEHQRTHGKIWEAHRDSAWAARIDLGTVLEYPGAAALTWFKTLRVHVDSGMTMFTRETDAVKAAGHLREVRTPLEEYYLNGDVFAIAQTIKRDGDSEYQMAAEMYRDIARYYLRLTELFGMPGLLQTALDSFDLAIENAARGSSARGLAGMERQMAAKPFQALDIDAFTRSYETTKRVNMREGNWNRLAIASLWHAQESLRNMRPGLAISSLKTMLFAEKKDGQPPGIDVAKSWARIYTARRRKMSFDSERISLRELALPVSPAEVFGEEL